MSHLLLPELLAGHVNALYTPLRAALQQEDFNGLEQLAHRLRGVAGNLGLVKLSKAAFNLEQAAHAGAAARCGELIEAWAEAFAAVRTALPLGIPPYGRKAHQ